MEIRDPELFKAVMNLPNSFDAYKQIATERFEKLESKLDDAVYVNLMNGDNQRMKVANILPKMYTDLKEIKASMAEFHQIKNETANVISMVKDFSRLHTIFKRYKFYWVIGIAIFLMMGVGVKDLLIEILKSALK